MRIKTFPAFLNESTTSNWKTNFLESVVDTLEQGASNGLEFDSVTLDEKDNTIEIDYQYVIDDDKFYSVMDISRPTIITDYTIILKFIFNDAAIKKFISPGQKFGLSDVKFSELFKLQASNTLEVTVEELEDFRHVEGDLKLSDYDVKYESLEDFLDADGISSDVSHLIEELLPPIPGQNLIRDLLDKYEEENS